MRLLSEIRNYMGNYHVKSGVYHYYRNEFKQAEGFLRKALADESELTEGDLRNARTYLSLSLKGRAAKLEAGGELAEAVGQLAQAAEVTPYYPDLHFQMARLLERLERLDEAIEAYRRAIACHPGFLDARVALAYCLVEAKRNKEAAEAFREALELKLARIERPFDEGVRLLERDESGESIPFFDEVFRAVPLVSDEHLKKALEWMRSEDHENALEDLDRAIELNPRYPDLHNFRGIVLCELERFDEAYEAFRTSSGLSPDHLVPRLNLAFAFVRAGRAQEAEAELESILERQPTEPAASAKLEELRTGRLPDKRGSVTKGNAR